MILNSVFTLVCPRLEITWYYERTKVRGILSYPLFFIQSFRLSSPSQLPKISFPLSFSNLILLYHPFIKKTSQRLYLIDLTKDHERIIQLDHRTFPVLVSTTVAPTSTILFLPHGRRLSDLIIIILSIPPRSPHHTKSWDPSTNQLLQAAETELRARLSPLITTKIIPRSSYSYFLIASY